MRGWVELHWWPALVPSLFGLKKNFTSYQLHQTSVLRSVYSWRLGIADAFRVPEWAKYTIQDSATSMDATAKQQENFNNIKKWIIEPAIEELTGKEVLLQKIRSLVQYDIFQGRPLMSDFKWHHFRGELILSCVRWYCKYGISYREPEEMMRERGFEVDHTTLYRWVQHFVPEMQKRLHWCYKPTMGYSWRVDETYVKIKEKGKAHICIGSICAME